MDILLAHGYFIFDDPHEREVMTPYPPLGLLYISAHLKAKEFDVSVFDSTFSDFASFQNRVIQEKPAIVGLYVTLMTKPTVLKMIDFCRQQGVWVVLGGPEPPYYAEEYLSYGADIVVTGEGELTLEELIPELMLNGKEKLEGIKGIAYLNDAGKLIHTAPRPQIADLDAQPMPDREAIDLPRYIDVWREHHGVGSINVVTARGCPYTCTWCSHSVFGETHRRRSPKLMADEVQYLVETYAPDQFWYVDDVFTINHRWLKEFAAELKTRGLRVPFECISRADRLNEDIIDLLAEMGCKRLWIGSESGSQLILDAMKRKTTVESVQKMTHALQKRGIETGMFIMLGYDGETIADITDTIRHLQMANPDIFLTTVAYPIKGTAYYESVKHRIIEPSDWQYYTDRDLMVGGRHSRRYYGFATRWMVNAVQWRRLQDDTSWKKYPRMAKSLANIAFGRVGMLATSHEVEGGKTPAGRGWYDEKRKSPIT